jgi:5-aminopentanamidase
MWKVAAVQMDCRLGDKGRNLATIRERLRVAANAGAHLVAFPECALTGYCVETIDEIRPLVEPLTGPSIKALAEDCRALGVWAVVGFLEQGDTSSQCFNAAALVGPEGIVASYRKIHLPCLGVDRFATPGDRPFEVHDLGGLRVGINICYDGSFPEASRILTLLGADLIVLPTNWPTGARGTVRHLVQARALENHVYYMAVNRTGQERGFQFIGQSRIVNFDGELLAFSEGNADEILYADLEPQAARQKQVVNIPGKYEINRVADRRPEMYGVLCSQMP